MALAEDLRNAIDTTLYGYEAKDGVGADAYCGTDSCHPMADGKCLQVLAVLRQSKLISAKQFEERSQRICSRLESRGLEVFEGGMCWGLDFSWRNLPATEPFLITTAIVIRGLLDCHNEGLVLALSSKLLREGSAGLEAWIRELALPVGQSGIDLPAYSPGIREPIYNAAAYALGTLKLIEDVGGFLPAGVGAGVLSAMEWIRSRRISGLGWPYSTSSPVVDLLHQCYILNACSDVFGVRSIESATAEMMGQFAGPCCFADVMRLVTEGVVESSDARDIPWLRFIGSLQVELLPKPARLWSLGELLVLLSRLGLDGERSNAWGRQGRRVADAILSRFSASDDVEARYPRHVMHAVHGLACYLALLRKKRSCLTTQ